MKHVLQPIPAALLTLSMAAHANVTITIEQTSSGVLVEGSGKILTNETNCNLPEIAPTSVSSKDAGQEFEMISSSPSLFFGSPQSSINCVFQEVVRTGMPIGSNTAKVVGNQNGDFFGVDASPSNSSAISLRLPAGYKSGEDLTFSALFAGKSLQNLGLIANGGYKWTWYTTQSSGEVIGISQQSLSIVVRAAPLSVPAAATPVPTLGAFGLMGLASAVAAAGVAMTRRRKPR